MVTKIVGYKDLWLEKNKWLKRLVFIKSGGKTTGGKKSGTKTWEYKERELLTLMITKRGDYKERWLQTAVVTNSVCYKIPISHSFVFEIGNCIFGNMSFEGDK